MLYDIELFRGEREIPTPIPSEEVYAALVQRHGAVRSGAAARLGEALATRVIEEVQGAEFTVATAPMVYAPTRRCAPSFEFRGAGRAHTLLVRVRRAAGVTGKGLAALVIGMSVCSAVGCTTPAGRPKSTENDHSEPAMRTHRWIRHQPTAPPTPAPRGLCGPSWIVAGRVVAR